MINVYHRFSVCIFNWWEFLVAFRLVINSCNLLIIFNRESRRSQAGRYIPGNNVLNVWQTLNFFIYFNFLVINILLQKLNFLLLMLFQLKRLRLFILVWITRKLQILMWISQSWRRIIWLGLGYWWTITEIKSFLFLNYKIIRNTYSCSSLFEYLWRIAFRLMPSRHGSKVSTGIGCFILVLLILSRWIQISYCNVLLNCIWSRSTWQKIIKSSGAINQLFLSFLR